MDIHSIIKQQRQFATEGQAKDICFRINQLRRLKDILKKNEEALYQAIYLDMKKSRFETYATELALVYQEIDEALGFVRKWSKTKTVKTGIANFPGKSFIMSEPYGSTLIIGAWNYPYQLTLAPLVAAMAAGNTAIIKPSELPVNASAVIARLINENFDASYLHVIEGGVPVTEELLAQRFDKLFFTGNVAVGKIVAKAAAEHLTPVTLELGGKSPCLVFADADLAVTARRIIWGKFLNAGQTCIAPDYLLVEKTIYEPFLLELKQQINKMAGTDPLNSESYLRIINKHHVQRLQKLIDPKKLFAGGEVIESENYIAPTLLRDVSFNDEIMQEEIFGPILPIISFTDLAPALQEIKNCPRPLALYLFTNNKKLQKQILKEVSFGGGCINDVLMHITNPRLPFGGIGNSGMGNYHGEAGFRAFSHYKSILKKPFWFEPLIKYPPYSKIKLKILRALFG